MNLISVSALFLFQDREQFMSSQLQTVSKNPHTQQ